MELTSEEVVTRLLSSNEIIKTRHTKPNFSETMCDLGEYLKTAKPEPSQYGIKYIFVK